jgi:hypothetical protein
MGNSDYHLEQFVPCDCVYDGHYMRMLFFLEKDADGPMMFVSVRNYPEEVGLRRWWQAIKLFWKTLRGHTEIFGEVTLRPTHIGTAYKFMGQFLKDNGWKTEELKDDRG